MQKDQPTEGIGCDVERDGVIGRGLLVQADDSNGAVLHVAAVMFDICDSVL